MKDTQKAETLAIPDLSTHLSLGARDCLGSHLCGSRMDITFIFVPGSSRMVRGLH